MRILSPYPWQTACSLGQHAYTFGNPPEPGITYRCANCGKAPLDGSAFQRETPGQPTPSPEEEKGVT